MKKWEIAKTRPLAAPLLVFALACLVSLGGAVAQTSQGAFVTQSEGAVSFQPPGGEQQPVLTFAHLFPGTKIAIDHAAKLQILYLQGGRQESWVGPAKFEIGAAESTAVSTGSAPKLKKLPPYLVSVLTKSREVINDIKVRQGMVRVRSLKTRRKVKKAKANYDEMRQASAADDITPEIYLLTALDGLKAYRHMRAPLAEILRRQPNNAQARELHDQFLEVLEGGLAGMWKKVP